MRVLVKTAVISVFLIVTVGCASETPSGLPTASPSRPPILAPLSPAASQPARPNQLLTPGATIPGATVEQICTPGYASRVRNVLPEQYRAVYSSYGISYPQPAGTYELDHLVPLELGGDNSDRNLWPEPAAPVPGFRQKDDLENTLHGLVCSGRLALADAQAGMATDWVRMYTLYQQP